MKYIRKHLKKILGILAVCLILAVSYWYGGNAPGSRGFVDSNDTQNTTRQVAVNRATEQASVTERASSETKQTAETSTQSESGNANQRSVTEEAVTTEWSKHTSTEAVTTEVTTAAEKETTTTEEVAVKTKKRETTTEAATEAATKVSTTETTTTEEPTEYSCTISINCSNIKKNWNLFDTSKASCVPSDGWILKETEVTFKKGDTVFDVLKDITKKRAIHMEYSFTALYGSYYIEGIGNLYEFDCGELSGWEYSVNGEFPSFGCSKYVLQDGDKIEWKYTCDLGADVGNPYEE